MFCFKFCPASFLWHQVSLVFTVFWSRSFLTLKSPTVSGLLEFSGLHCCSFVKVLLACPSKELPNGEGGI